MWTVKAIVLPLIIRVLGVLTPKMGKSLKQIPGMTSLPRKVQPYKHQRYCAGPSSLKDKDHPQGEWEIFIYFIYRYSYNRTEREFRMENPTVSKPEGGSSDHKV